MTRVCSRFSLISVVCCCSVVGFGGLPFPRHHVPTVEEESSSVQLCAHADEHTAKLQRQHHCRSPRASQRHGFPPTLLCRRLELQILPPVSGGSLLCRSKCFICRLLNLHPLKSRPITLSQEQSNFYPPPACCCCFFLLLSNPLYFSHFLPPNSFQLPLSTPPLHSACSPAAALGQ